MQRIAALSSKSVDELVSDMIDQCLSSTLDTLEFVLSEFQDELANESTGEREKLYQEYYAHPEEDLNLVQNMRTAQMRAFATNEGE